MPLNYAALKSWPFPDVEHRYTARDTMLYALGLGCGSDPIDPDELQFVFEEGLRALPTMPVVLDGPGFWMRNEKTDVDWRNSELYSTSFFVAVATAFNAIAAADAHWLRSRNCAGRNGPQEPP